MSNGGSKSTSFHFLAGLSSGVSTAFLLQPADLLKTRIQQSSSGTLRATLTAILNGPDPLRSLWRGTVPSVIRTGAGSALYFGMLNNLRQWVARSNLTTAGTAVVVGGSSTLPRLSNTANLLTGACARATAGFLLSPVTVLKVRYESSYYAYTSLSAAAKHVLATNGMRGFFAGFGATAARDAPYAGLYVLFYEQAKSRISAMTTGRCDAVATTSFAPGINFASGALAASAATAITNPFDAIKTRLQLMPAKYGNMLQAGSMLLRDEGPRSFFDGLALRMARKAISSALAWTVYEELIRRVESTVHDAG